ncbi:MAG: peptide chain release factor N(5)-glutamine methyltransferase [Gemmatimonadetes bacterium]|nr:peptide chain release factor N(5)-glutamine methyltransferase [Gemmatimonadota bacterium]
MDASGADRQPARKPHQPTRREALEGITRELEVVPVESARVEAERLLALAVGVERPELLLALDLPLESDEALRLARSTRRRVAGEPLQHIEATVQFRDLVLLADARALVPRPETEQLVDRIAIWARARATGDEAAGDGAADGPGDREDQDRGSARPVERPKSVGDPTGASAGEEGAGGEAILSSALDIGTGSAAIALSLVREGIVRRVVGLDSSAAALEQAAENRTRCGLTEKEVELRAVDRSLWDAVAATERFDVIVSNPPYVTAAEMAELSAEVHRDPPEALLGGEDGLDIIREIVRGAWYRLAPGGALFLEIGERQGASVKKLLEGAHPWLRVAVEPDLAGKDRFAFAQKP